MFCASCCVNMRNGILTNTNQRPHTTHGTPTHTQTETNTSSLNSHIEHIILLSCKNLDLEIKNTRTTCAHLTSLWKNMVNDTHHNQITLRRISNCETTSKRAQQRHNTRTQRCNHTSNHTSQTRVTNNENASLSKHADRHAHITNTTHHELNAAREKEEWPPPGREEGE